MEGSEKGIHDPLTRPSWVALASDGMDVKDEQHRLMDSDTKRVGTRLRSSSFGFKTRTFSRHEDGGRTFFDPKKFQIRITVLSKNLPNPSQ